MSCPPATRGVNALCTLRTRCNIKLENRENCTKVLGLKKLILSHLQVNGHFSLETEVNNIFCNSHRNRPSQGSNPGLSDW